jgi:hypothetical protein
MVTLGGVCRWSQFVDRPESSPGCRAFPEAPFPLWMQALAYAPDGRTIVGQDSSGVMAAWDAVSGRLLATIDPQGTAGQRSNVGMLLTPDGRSLLVGTRHGLIVFATDTWREVRRVPVALDPTIGGGVRPIAVLDAGRTLLGGVNLGGLGANWLVWLDAETFVVRRTQRLPERVKSITVSRDGTRIATGAADGTVRVWAADGTLLHRMAVAGQAQGVVFIDDERLGVTPNRGSIYVESLDPAALLAMARAGLTRAFTAEECRQYGLDPCPTLEAMRAGPASP